MTGVGRPVTGLVFLIAACVAVTGVQTARAVQQTAPPQEANAVSKLPTQMGSWTLVPLPESAVNPSVLDDKGHPTALYDRVVSRAYRREDGATIMLMVVYKLSQHQEDRIHRPELCYYAQGFVVRDRGEIPLNVGGQRLPAIRFVADGLDRREQVLYWIRSGDLISGSAWKVRGDMFVKGLLNQIPDGVLVRASLLSNPASSVDVAQGDRMLSSFMEQLLTAAPPATRFALAGAKFAQAGTVASRDAK